MSRAKQEERTESLPNLNGETFKVGEGAHTSFNGDSYPYTVVRVSKSGRKVWVSRDTYKIIDDLGGFVEGHRKCEFTTVAVAEDQLTCYTLRKSGHFHVRSGSKGYAWSLQSGRFYSQNPSF